MKEKIKDRFGNLFIRKYCKVCGHYNRLTANFCENCGNAIITRFRHDDKSPEDATEP